ncbi:MAG: TRAP transporter small permease [Pseudomonadota bacterium]
MRIFNQVCDILRNIVRVYILLIAAALFAVVIMTVFTREALGWVYSWSEEVPRYLLIWLAFMSAAVCVDVKDHIAFDYFYQRIQGIAGKLVKSIVNLGIIGFGFIMTWFGIDFVQDFGGDAMESIPFTNIWYYPSLPIAGALIMLFAMRDLLNIWLAPELRTQPASIALEAE